MYCPEKSKIQDMENALSKKFWEYSEKHEKEVTKRLEKDNPRPMMVFLHSQKIVSDMFLRDHTAELIDLHRQYDMEFKEYQQIMDKVKRFIFNSTSIIKHRKRSQ